MGAFVSGAAASATGSVGLPSEPSPSPHGRPALVRQAQPEGTEAASRREEAKRIRKEADKEAKRIRKEADREAKALRKEAEKKAKALKKEAGKEAKALRKRGSAPPEA
jgi:cell division septum initiation protein DivIVA